MMTSAEKNDIVVQIGKVFNAEYPVWSGVYDKIETALDYIAGEQYSEARRKWYESQRRPTNVYNLMLSAYNRVMGDFILTDINDGRQVERLVDFYNLEMILAVGYRVRSHRGKQFRKWATERLSEWMILLKKSYSSSHRYCLKMI
jgi:hypothetical protein